MVTSSNTANHRRISGFSRNATNKNRENLACSRPRLERRRDWAVADHGSVDVQWDDADHDRVVDGERLQRIARTQLVDWVGDDIFGRAGFASSISGTDFSGAAGTFAIGTSGNNMYLNYRLRACPNQSTCCCWRSGLCWLDWRFGGAGRGLGLARWFEPGLPKQIKLSTRPALVNWQPLEVPSKSHRLAPIPTISAHVPRRRRPSLGDRR